MYEKTDLQAVFVKNLLSLMERNGLDRFGFADRLKIRYSTIGGWINCKKMPKIETLQEIAAEFNLKPTALLEENCGFTPSNSTIHGLTLAEKALLTDFRQLTDERKRQAVEAVKGQLLLQQSEKKEEGRELYA